MEHNHGSLEDHFLSKRVISRFVKLPGCTAWIFLQYVYTIIIQKQTYLSSSYLPSCILINHHVSPCVTTLHLVFFAMTFSFAQPFFAKEIPGDVCCSHRKVTSHPAAARRNTGRINWDANEGARRLAESATNSVSTQTGLQNHPHDLREIPKKLQGNLSLWNGQLTCKWPFRRANGAYHSWLLNGGFLNHVLTNWSDPPSIL